MMKIKLSLLISVMTLFCTTMTQANTDACHDIPGSWQGKGQAEINKVICYYDMKSKITRLHGDTYLSNNTLTLTSGGKVCPKDEHKEEQVHCQDNHIAFNDAFITFSGTVENDTIHLSGTTKTLPKIVAKATLHKETTSQLEE